MTAVMQQTNQQLWSSMPGWGIVADLTPPELIASRRLRVIRKLIALAAIVLLLLCGLTYGYAYLQSQSASHALAAETNRTTSLQAEQQRFSEVTRLQTSLNQVQTQLSRLLGGDVSIAPLVADLRGNLRPGMTIAQVSVNISGPGAAAAASGNTLDTSGRPHIGTMSLTGTAVKLTDVAAFVDKLAALPGFVDVVAPSSQQSTSGVQYSITASFTDQVLSHQFDLKSGSK
jgi:hypothetical protein